jgi:plastocyanin
VLAVIAGLLALAVAPGASADLGIDIKGFTFDPQVMTIHVGQSVSWTNSDPQNHTATADDGSFDTGTILNGDTSAGVQFTTVGTFPYHCRIHPSMTGTVVVEAATSPPTSTLEPTTAATASPAVPVVMLVSGVLGLILVARQLRSKATPRAPRT